MMLDENKVHAMLQKVRSIELRTRMLMNDSLAGSYHSIFKGQGVNFEEIREYTPGDEIRFIDWNSSAKLGHPFVKIFKEERELTLILAIDVSGSTLCGSANQSKREFETEIASLLAFSALKNNDRIGLFLFSDCIEKYIPPQKGRQQLLRIIREALFFKPQHTRTDLNACLQGLGKMLKKKSIICFISDFISTSDVSSLAKSMARINQHHDLICIKINDPREKLIPDVGFIALEDAENHTTTCINTHSEKLRKEFEIVQQKREKEFQDLCGHQGIDLLSLTNGQSYDNEIKSFFKKRQQLHV